MRIIHKHAEEVGTESRGCGEKNHDIRFKQVGQTTKNARGWPAMPLPLRITLTNTSSVKRKTLLTVAANVFQIIY